MQVDALIIGQGVAGSCLAWELRRRGLSLAAVDDSGTGRASPVGAGIINPVLGKRFNLAAGIEKLDTARSFYSAMENDLGRRFFHELDLVKVFKSDDEAARWGERQSNPDFQRYSLESPAAAGRLGPDWHDPQGSVVVTGGGWADLTGICKAMEARLGEYLIRKTFAWEEVNLSENRVRWKEVEARWLVDCTGWRASQHPRLSALPWRLSQGEILDLKMGAQPIDRIVNQGHWLLPQGEDQWRAGATYQWSPLNGIPTAIARHDIETGLRAFCRAAWNITDQRAGIRSALPDAYPILGALPDTNNRVWILNGLGSKGALWAPLLACGLADALECQNPVNPGHNLGRFL